MQSLNVDTVGVVDAARALADLVEISPQIEAAAVVARDGEIAGSVGVPDGRATILTRAARELIGRAAEFRHGDGHVTQLHAALADGAVFAVTGADEQTIVAVTSGRPTPGLVFYDLKSCLSRLADET
jgi:predicted regulator of Ras-like GTPase activity (Roadblock/LC7/MglB family)